MERKTKAATQTGVYLLLVAAILVVANVISYSVYKRFDVTKNERFTLSKGSARMVKEELKQDLQIDVYVTRGLPKHEAFIQDLSDLLDEYERAGGGKVKYSIIEPKTEEQRAAAREAGLQEAAFGEGSETGSDQMNISKGFMGMVFKYGSEKEAIPILSPDNSLGLEFWITNKIREIRDRADNINQKFGVLTGKDEIKLTDQNLIAGQPGRPGPNMRGILEQALPFYKFEDVDLQGGDAEINKELVGLIITQPGKEFTEKELRRIDQFLMQGGKALVAFAGAVNLKAEPSMKATLNTWGLEKLFEGYGIEMKKEAILDWSRSLAIPVPTQSGQLVWLRAPGILQIQEDTGADEKEQMLDTSFAGFFRIPELAFPFPSTLVPHPEKQPEAKIQVVARTSPNTTVDTSESIEMKLSPDWKPKTSEYAQRAIAISVEGKLKSAYGGQEGLGISAPAQSPEPSRVLVVSASQFLANPFARAGNPPPMPPQMAMMGGMGGDEELQMISQPYAQKYLTNTIVAFKNTLDWMAGDSTLLAASAKILGDPNLTYAGIEKPKQEATDDETALNRKVEEYREQRLKVQRRVQWTLTLLPALVFAGFGLFRWRRREAARDRISLD